MKQKIKDILLKKIFFKKGIKVFKNKKGFSLLEVLVAVGIIGIISAIAIPQFAEQRENAAQVASDTSAGNIAKAFQNCVVLKSFSDCNSLSQLKIACPSGSSCHSSGTSPNFCAHIKRGNAGQDDFNVCVTVNSNTGEQIRIYGGALLAKKNIAHVTETSNGTCVAKNGGNEYAVSPIDECDPNTRSTYPSNVVAATNVCPKTYSCKKATSGGGTCQNNGTCL